MSAAKKIWSAGWRVGVGSLLLLWIFHSIFVNEAREQARRGELVDQGAKVNWAPLSRTEQWRYGWRFGPPALWKTLRSIEPTPLAFSLALMGTTLVLGIVRWRMVLRVQGFDLSFGRTAEISLVAHFFNSFLLGTAGGDVMKAYFAARETHHKKTEAVVTVFVDRVIGLWAMLLFATLMILPNLRLFERSGLRTSLGLIFTQPSALFRTIIDEPIVTAAAMLVGMTIVGSIFVFLAFRGGVSRGWSGAREWLRKLPKGDWLERSLDSCREFGKQRGFVIRTLALSMLLNVALRASVRGARARTRHGCFLRRALPHCAYGHLHLGAAHFHQRPRCPRKPFRPIARDASHSRIPDGFTRAIAACIRRQPFLERDRRSRLHDVQAEASPGGERVERRGS
jgi:uncharacterized membrane protein YbhN (UPF0104 family)